MDETVFETKLIFDEEKIKTCPYVREQVYEYLEGLFQSVGMRRDGDTFRDGTFARITAAMVILYEKEWFMRIVKEWTLVEKEGDVVVTIENVLANKLLRKKYLDKYGL